MTKAPNFLNQKHHWRRENIPDAWRAQTRVDRSALRSRGFFHDVQATGALAEKFIYPPFTVLNAHGGEWRRRKNAWLRLGIKSGAGRGEGLLSEGGAYGSATSIFDPVLAELIYTWWCPIGGAVLDPFAGGSVRGVVAASLGLHYWGCDLSTKQINANRQQAKRFDFPGTVTWVIGDSCSELSAAPRSDLVIACPPYFDLEVYSDSKKDLSNMTTAKFTNAYKQIIYQAVSKLNGDRFACFVVGNARGKDGFYRDLCGLTVQAFAEAGAGYYIDAVLATPLASAAVRATRIARSGKLTPVHQHVMVFCKGDWKKAGRACQKDEGDKW